MDLTEAWARLLAASCRYIAELPPAAQPWYFQQVAFFATAPEHPELVGDRGMEKLAELAVEVPGEVGAAAVEVLLRVRALERRQSTGEMGAGGARSNRPGSRRARSTSSGSRRGESHGCDPAPNR